LVADNDVVWQFERFFQRAPDVTASLLVGGISRPNLNSVSGLTYTYNQPAYIVRGSYRFPDASENSPKPHLVQTRASTFGRDRNGPFPSLGVSGILPLGFNVFLEDMVVASLGKRAGRLEVVENSPEIFHGIKRSDFSEMIAP